MALHDKQKHSIGMFYVFFFFEGGLISAGKGYFL